MENTFSINTSHNVKIAHTLASAGERILSHILDYCFILAYFFIFFMIPAMMNIRSGVYYIVMLLPVFLYDLIFENFYNGQSPGKMIMGIKVVMLSGKSPSFFNYFVRWIFRIIDSLLLSGAIATITILISNKGQRLGDIAAGTTVVKIRKNISSSNLIHISIPENYQPVYETAKLLKDEDIPIIKESLQFLRSHPESENYEKIAQQIREKLNKKLGVNSKEHILIYLDTVLKDYNYFYK